MNELLSRGVALIALGLLGYVLLAILVGIVKAMLSSGSGTASGSRTASRGYRSGNDDQVQWYDKSRP